MGKTPLYIICKIPSFFILCKPFFPAPALPARKDGQKIRVIPSGAERGRGIPIVRRGLPRRFAPRNDLSFGGGSPRRANALLAMTKCRSGPCRPQGHGDRRTNGTNFAQISGKIFAIRKKGEKSLKIPKKGVDFLFFLC